MILYGKENYPEAIQYLTKSVLLDTALIDNYLYLGYIYENQKNISEANNYFNILISKLDTLTFDDKYMKGDYLFKMKRYDQAILQFSKCIKLDSLNANAYNFRAWVKIFNNQYESALNDCNIAISLDSLNGGIFDSRALARHKLNDFNGALLDYDIAIKLSNGVEGEFFLRRGDTKYELKDFEGACKDWSISNKMHCKESNEKIIKYCKN
jgi:tetratricopeptide (TPR) repeat protein